MPTKQVFVQMSGVPGAGKTTLSRALAPHVGAVVLDHDISKSALLGAEVPVELAGRASYEVLHALAVQMLQQGFSVIFDSPCFYDNLLVRGQQIANEAGTRYYYIECRLDDLDVLDHRLRSRSRDWVNTGDYYFETPGEGFALVAGYTSDEGALGRMLAALQADARCLGITLSWRPAGDGGQWNAVLTWIGNGGSVAYHAQDACGGAGLGGALLAALGLPVQEQEQ